MPTFPSEAWMTAYADRLAGHPRAEELSSSLAGRYRFVITPGGGYDDQATHDLVVEPGGVFSATSADYREPAVLTVTAGYARWKGLITGKADFVMSYLMRRIKVEGDVTTMRQRVSDAKPLLECLREVPSEFPS